MECENYNSNDLTSEIIKTDYIYNSYFNNYLKEDAVKFKCNKCGYEWIETI
ncbi:hypothetical protein [Clostridium paraputrificum]|uniref:hypothetical protein n=1 Tax=Clostridium paraputrificum TaxID=29363 RepID=UPI00189C5EF2|nr:hypothetical protein [Clostridium paraputrificum]